MDASRRPLREPATGSGTRLTGHPFREVARTRAVNGGADGPAGAARRRRRGLRGWTMLTVARGRQVFPWVRLASRCSWTDPESGAAFSSAMNDAPCFQLLRGGGAYSRPRDTYRLHPLPPCPLPPDRRKGVLPT